jgi:23S rRNA pseudouridine1911/1915/1917 synthase
VRAEEAGARLDRFLAERLPEVSRTRIQELIRDRGVRVDGAPATRPAQHLEVGQCVEVVDVPRSRERRGAPPGARFEVVHEDEHLVVVDKPAGMVSHPSSVVRGGTVSELASERWGPLPAPQGADRPGLVHRLDAGTSGLMAIARTELAAEALLRAFREHAVAKTYLAIVAGEPRFDSDWIERPIARSRRHPDRMEAVAAGEGREAATFYEVRERYPGFALLECHPRTGRTHQIRVHLAAIELPLVGDELYRGRTGAGMRLPPGAPRLERQALHAAGLSFVHPATGEPLALASELPDDMRRLRDWLRRERGR